MQRFVRLLVGSSDPVMNIHCIGTRVDRCGEYWYRAGCTPVHMHEVLVWVHDLCRLNRSKHLSLSLSIYIYICIYIYIYIYICICNVILCYML